MSSRIHLQHVRGVRDAAWNAGSTPISSGSASANAMPRWSVRLCSFGASWQTRSKHHPSTTISPLRRKEHPWQATASQCPPWQALDQYMGSHEAVASLLDLKSGAEGYMRSPAGKPSKRIDDVMLTAEQIEELFNMQASFRYFCSNAR